MHQERNMKNFFTEHEGYNKLKAKLIRSSEPNLVCEMIDVVKAAIQYGIDSLAKEVKNDTDRTDTRIFETRP